MGKVASGWVWPTEVGGCCQGVARGEAGVGSPGNWDLASKEGADWVGIGQIYMASWPAGGGQEFYHCRVRFSHGVLGRVPHTRTLRLCLLVRNPSAHAKVISHFCLRAE